MRIEVSVMKNQGFFRWGFLLFLGLIFSFKALAGTALFTINNTTPFQIVNQVDSGTSQCTSPAPGFLQCTTDQNGNLLEVVVFLVNGAGDPSTPALLINTTGSGNGSNISFSPATSTRYDFRAQVSPSTWSGKDDIQGTINFSCINYYCPLTQP